MCECDPSSPASIPWWLVAARGAHLGACLLLFGFLAFDKFVAGPVVRRRRLDAPPPGRVLLPLAVVAAAVSGAAWLVLVAADMCECSPARAARPDLLRLVWGQTHFGGVWQARRDLWLAAAVPVLWAAALRRSSRLRSALTWLALPASGGLLAGLAWAGHGLTGRGPLQPWHLPADVLHLLVAGLWPAGLLPLAIWLWRIRRDRSPEARAATGEVIRRFSAMSLAAVALMTATGVVNSCPLVGSVAALKATPYGRCLLVKVALLVPMIGLGAVNLLRLKPRLSSPSGGEAERAVGRLRVNVSLEFVLGMLVIAAVALLGVLPPAAE